MDETKAASMFEMPDTIGDKFVRASRLVRIDDVAVLEAGTYWPDLRPHFANPDYRRLRYTVEKKAQNPGECGSVRGASSIDLLDIAFVADRHEAALTIAGAGLPDYCLTLIQRGGLVCSGVAAAGNLQIGQRMGLIYRGRPGTRLTASGSHERIAIWIPAGGLRQRLSALIGEHVHTDIEFQPQFEWTSPAVRNLRSLIGMMLNEVGDSRSFLTLESAGRSFSDLFLYTLLRSVPHSHLTLLERPAAGVLPGMQKRAEAYIEANLTGPLALHEIAAAAGCSVRSLQAGFHRYRETTPLAFIREVRLRAARVALEAGAPGTTVTGVALHYGFTNPGRFAGHFRRAFGVSPAKVLHRATR